MAEERCEKDFTIKVVSETVADDGFVDCVWEMPVWLIEKLEAGAKKRKISLSQFVNLILDAGLEEKKKENERDNGKRCKKTVAREGCRLC